MLSEEDIDQIRARHRTISNMPPPTKRMASDDVTALLDEVEHRLDERDRLKARVAELTGLLQTGVALFETDDEAQQPGTDAYTWRVQTDAALAQGTKP